MEKRESEGRLEHYSRVYESAKFTDWNRFHLCLNDLEETLLATFSDNTPLVKLVGSSATRTMRKGEEDLDFAVAFQSPMSNEEFLERIGETDLRITDVNQNKKYGYVRISGKHNEMDFVLVPMRNPNGNIQTYEQDAFYHPEFINKNKQSTHARNVILMKEFFEQIGAYKEVKGIGCELMTLYFRDFDLMLDAFAKRDALRINFSADNLIYSQAPLVIDYPYLGRRSFTEKVTQEIYGHIQESARKVLEDYEILKVKEK